MVANTELIHPLVFSCFLHHTAVPVVEVVATPQARIAVGQDVSLLCNITRANPMVIDTFTWSFNGSLQVTETSDTLTLINVTLTQFGTYQCNATNVAGTGSGEIVIEEGGQLHFCHG